MCKMARNFILANTASRIAMPSIGLGTYLLNGREGKKAIDCAIFNGYRHIDTATRYQNETDIGEVVQSNIKSGFIKRNELFITTKIPTVYLAPKDMKLCLEKSLEYLKMSYVDMLLIHMPWGNRNRGDGETEPVDKFGTRELENYDLSETWAAMEELIDQGKALGIGLSNFSIRLIEQIWNKARIKPSNLQCEGHFYLQQKNLLKYCESKKIVMTAYAPFGAPTKPGRPNGPCPLNDPKVQNIASKLNRTPAQLSLRHLLQQNIAVIPQSDTEAHLKENLDVYDFYIEDKHMQELNSLDRKQKIYTFDWAKAHPLYIGGEEF